MVWEIRAVLCISEGSCDGRRQKHNTLKLAIKILIWVLQALFIEHYHSRIFMESRSGATSFYVPNNLFYILEASFLYAWEKVRGGLVSKDYYEQSWMLLWADGSVQVLWNTFKTPKLALMFSHELLSLLYYSTVCFVRFT